MEVRKMTCFCIAFLAGSLLTAAGVMLADSRTGVMFIAGGIALLILQAALLASTSRARRLAAFVVAVCDSLDTPTKETPQIAPKAQDGQVVEDLTSALINMGMKNRKRAAAIAADAAADGGSLPQMIQRATVAAARVN
jgi:hypothetical protein